MQEGDALSLGADARGLVDELDAVGLAARQHGVEIVHGKTNVMDAGPALGKELPDGGVGLVWLEEFDQRVSRDETGDARTIGVIECGLGKAEDVPIEGQDAFQGRHGDPEMGDAGPAWGGVGHGSAIPEMRNAANVSVAHGRTAPWAARHT